MPTIEQLPEAPVVNPTDILMIDQSGISSSATVANLTAGLQPLLTLAPGALLGRVGMGPGQPQPIGVGVGLAMSNGSLTADTTVVAPLSSPALTGTPTAPTPLLNDSSNKIATTAFVQQKYFQPVTIVGDVTGVAAPTTGVIAAILPSIATPGTYNQVTVNAKGQVTSGSALSGSGLSNVDLSTGLVQATGATHSATLASHAALQLDAVVDFGADPSGISDSTAALQAAISALQSAGGGRLRVVGQFKISATLTVTSSNIALEGLGHGQLHGDLSWSAPSRLFWAGANGGTMLAISPSANTTTGKALIAVEVSDILFDCQSLAATGIRIASVRHGRFRLAYFNPAAGNTLQAGIVFDTADIAEYNDTQFNNISIVGAELGSGGRGILLQAKSRGCLVAGQPYFGNVSYNIFKTVDVHYWRGVPITLRETDNNVFEIWGANAPPAVPPAFPTPNYATSNSVEIEGSSDSIWAFPAISNVFVHGGVAGPIMCRGIPSFTQASGAGSPPNPNLFLRLDKGNGVPDPTIETGAYAVFGDLFFIDNGKGLTQATLSDTRTGIELLRAKLASLGSAGGAAFHSSTGAAARLFSSDVAQSWTIEPGIDGSLSFVPTSASYFPLNIGQSGAPELRLNGATNGNPVGISAYNSATANVSMALSSQGTGTIYSATGNGIQFQITDSGGVAANILSVRGATSGNSPALQVYGSDTNVDLTLAGQGAGLVRAPNAPGADNSTALATTAWVQGKNYLVANSPIFSIANGIIANAAQPANAAVDVVAPLSGTTYIDNVLSLQNNSVNASGKAGNAAIRFRASTIDGGYERGAIGYSAPLNAAFFQHLLYAEIGNIAATSDANDTDFAIVNTHAAGAVHLPGTSYQAFTVQGSTGNITLTGPTGVTTTWNATTGIFGTAGLLSLSAGTPLTLGTPQGTVLKLNDAGQPALSSLTVTAGNGGTPVVMAVSGETNQGYSIRSSGNGQINFQSGAGGSTNSLSIIPNSNAVNALSVTGGSSGSPVVLGVNGSDPNVSIAINPQGAGTVAISKIAAAGGTIDNTIIGASVPSSASFSSTVTPIITSSGSAGISLGTTQGVVLQVKDNSVPALSKLLLTPGNGGTPAILAVTGETNQGFSFRSAGSGQINFQSGAGGSSNSLTVMPNSAAVNALSVTGGSAGSPVVIGVNGADTNVTIDINPQGSGTVYISKFQGAGGTIDNTVIGGNTASSGTFTNFKTTGLASFTAGLADASYSNQTPNSGFSISVPNGVSTLQLTPAATLASGTVTMPSAPGNGQWLLVSSTSSVTSCNFVPAAGQTMLGAPTTLPACVEMAFQYQSGASRWVCQSGNDARVASVASTAAMMFGTGADGAVTISAGTTTLTRDMHYSNLTISGAGVLNPAGWRVFIAGVLDLSSAGPGAIVANGIAANNAVAATPGAAPGGLSLRTVGQSPSTGGGGGAGSTAIGAVGAAGSSITYGNGGNGGIAGSGGAASSSGGSGATGGVQTIQIPLNTPTMNFWCAADNGGLAAGLIGGGGGGGGGDGTNAGGGGGSGGSYGGCIALYARNINRGSNTAASIIQAKGSNGGSGAAGVAGNAAGGGGGGGGGGGLIYIITEALLGASIPNALDVSGGTGGSGGNGSGSGKGGNGGAGGGGGSVQILNLLTPSFTASSWNVAGSAGLTTSTSVGAIGGAGSQLKATL